MEKNLKIYGLIGLARRAGKVSFGTESSKEEIKKGKAKLVLIAEDCSKKTQKNMEELAKMYQVPVRIVGTIEDLSQSIGQENKVIIVIKEENFAKEILKRIDGGELIG